MKASFLADRVDERNWPLISTINLEFISKREKFQFVYVKKKKKNKKESVLRAIGVLCEYFGEGRREEIAKLD